RRSSELKNDPLYGVSGTRGFFELGDVDPIEPDSDHSGLREIMDSIPDDEAKELQALAIQFSEATEDGDLNDGVQELTGVNLDLFERLKEDKVSTYFGSGGELDQKVEEMDEKDPDVWERTKKLTSSADDMFQKFVKDGYMNAYQKDLIVKELTNIESELEDIEEQVSNWKEYRAPSNYVYGQPPQDLSQLILTDLWAKNGLEEKYGNIIESFERLNSDDLKEVLDMIRSDHQIQTVLNTLSSDSNRSYDKNGDMILTGSGDIKVNMSAAMRMYEEGQSLLEDKEE